MHHLTRKASFKFKSFWLEKKQDTTKDATQDIQDTTSNEDSHGVLKCSFSDQDTSVRSSLDASALSFINENNNDTSAPLSKESLQNLNNEKKLDDVSFTSFGELTSSDAMMDRNPSITSLGSEKKEGTGTDQTLQDVGKEAETTIQQFKRSASVRLKSFKTQKKRNSTIGATQDISDDSHDVSKGSCSDPDTLVYSACDVSSKTLIGGKYSNDNAQLASGAQKNLKTERKQDHSTVTSGFELTFLGTEIDKTASKAGLGLEINEVGTEIDKKLKDVSIDRETTIQRFKRTASVRFKSFKTPKKQESIKEATHDMQDTTSKDDGHYVLSSSSDTDFTVRSSFNACTQAFINGNNNDKNEQDVTTDIKNLTKEKKQDLVSGTSVGELTSSDAETARSASTVNLGSETNDATTKTEQKLEDVSKGTEATIQRFKRTASLRLKSFRTPKKRDSTTEATHVVLDNISKDDSHEILKGSSSDQNSSVRSPFDVGTKTLINGTYSDDSTQITTIARENLNMEKKQEDSTSTSVGELTSSAAETARSASTVSLASETNDATTKTEQKLEDVSKGTKATIQRFKRTASLRLKSFRTPKKRDSTTEATHVELDNISKDDSHEILKGSSSDQNSSVRSPFDVGTKTLINGTYSDDSTQLTTMARENLNMEKKQEDSTSTSGGELASSDAQTDMNVLSASLGVENNDDGTGTDQKLEDVGKGIETKIQRFKRTASARFKSFRTEKKRESTTYTTQDIQYNLTNDQSNTIVKGSFSDPDTSVGSSDDGTKTIINENYIDDNAQLKTAVRENLKMEKKQDPVMFTCDGELASSDAEMDRNASSTCLALETDGAGTKTDQKLEDLSKGTETTVQRFKRTTSVRLKSIGVPKKRDTTTKATQYIQGNKKTDDSSDVLTKSFSDPQTSVRSSDTETKENYKDGSVQLAPAIGESLNTEKKQDRTTMIPGNGPTSSDTKVEKNTSSSNLGLETSSSVTGADQILEEMSKGTETTMQRFERTASVRFKSFRTKKKRDSATEGTQFIQGMTAKGDSYDNLEKSFSDPQLSICSSFDGAADAILNESQYIEKTKVASTEDIELLKDMCKRHYIDKSSRKECQGCRKPFSLKRRSFHCRRCGEVFCRKCVLYKRKLNRLAQPDPEGVFGKVCSTCFENSVFVFGSFRKLTELFVKERVKAKNARVQSQREQSLACSFWRDQLDVHQECKRLVNGFQNNVIADVMKFQDIRNAISLKTPSWQKSPHWEIEKKLEACRKCKAPKRVKKRSGICRVCGVSLCKRCCNKDLLVYFPDTDTCGSEAMLAIINTEQCPGKEPRISLLLYVCDDCRTYIIEQQQISAVWFRGRKTSDVISSLLNVDAKLHTLGEDLYVWLTKAKERTEIHCKEKKMSDTEKQELEQILHNLRLTLNDYEDRIRVARELIQAAETNTQKRLLENYCKSKHTFFFKHRIEYRKITNRM